MPRIMFCLIASSALLLAGCKKEPSEPSSGTMPAAGAAAKKDAAEPKKEAVSEAKGRTWARRRCDRTG
ncbi:MAG: hypothetical protein IPK83_14160 [Planctomycetes bacterium]|nr:hypothetical protein [Planctomycetota bacterium]